MNNQAALYFKVGLGSLVAVVAAVMLVLFLLGSLQHGKTFTADFTNAKGIKDKEVVQMSGVNVGQVGNVHLTPENKAEMQVYINKGIRVPVGSKFTISNTILGNQSIMTIVPSDNPQELPDGAVVTGDSSDPLGDALGKSGKLIDTVQQTLLDSQKLVQKLTKSAALLDDPKRIAKIDATLDNMQAATAGLPHLEMQVTRELDGVSAQTHELLAGMNGTLANANTAASGASKLTNGLNDTLAENRKTLHALLKNANETATSVGGFVDLMKTTLGDKKLHDALSGASQNMAATTANLQSISAKLDATATDVQRLADDPRMNADVRETVTNLRATSESVRDLAARAQGIRLPGERRKPADGATESNSTPALPHYFSTNSLLEPGLVFDSTYDTKRERLRFDADYTLLHGQPGAFYRAGLYDATYGDRLNLEAGQGLFGNRFDYRYGLIAGKLGAGFDLRAGLLDFRLDAYDPNRGTVNVRAKANINAATSVTAGIDSIGHGDRATVGVQIRK